MWWRHGDPRPPDTEMVVRRGPVSEVAGRFHGRAGEVAAMAEDAGGGGVATTDRPGVVIHLVMGWTSGWPHILRRFTC